MESSRELLTTLSKTPRGEAAQPKAELAGRYRPVLQAFARRIGVEASKIEAAVEAAMEGLYENAWAEDFDPELETRERLFGLMKIHIAEVSLSASNPLQTDEALHTAWEAEWRRGLVRFSITVLSKSTDTDARALQAFELHVIEKHTAGDVAKELGMSHTAVFGAKNLLLGKLQRLMGELEGRF